MLKKYSCVLIALMMMLITFCGCSYKEIPEKSDIYDNGNWDRNLFEHWQKDGRLEKINISEHDFKKGVCSVCKSKIEDLGDSFVLINFNENSDIRRETRYDLGGNLINEINYEYDNEGRLVNELEHKYYYSKNDILQYSKLFQRGVLLFEYEYAVSEEGSVYAKKQICHDGENGSSLTEFDEYGNALIYNTFDKNGEKIMEITSEYAHHPNGGYYLKKEVILDYGRNEKITYEYDEHFQYILMINEDLAGIYYYEDVFENEYDENGNLVFRRRILNGELFEETYFREPLDLGYITEKHIVYGSDGSFTVFEYDENGKETSAVDYDPEGNIIRGFPFGQYSSERIFTNHLNSNLGFRPEINFTVSEDSILTEYNGENKTFEISGWEWEEFPFSKEEWAGFFDNPEQLIDLAPYGKIMYKPISHFQFMLFSNGDFACVSLMYLNMGSYNQLVIWHIEKLIPAE